jgi:hypothetical protein
MDVDGDDHLSFALCVTGPGLGPVVNACRCMDLDRDGDVDLADWARFQAAYTGPTP